MESDVRGRGMWCERVRRGSVREGRKKKWGRGRRGKRWEEKKEVVWKKRWGGDRRGRMNWWGRRGREVIGGEE